MLRKVCNLLGIKSRSADETQLPNENVGSYQSISDWAFIIILNYYTCVQSAKQNLFHASMACGMNAFKNIWSPLRCFNHFPTLVVRHLFKTLSHPCFVCEESNRQKTICCVVWCLVGLQDVIAQVVSLSLLHCLFFKEGPVDSGNMLTPLLCPQTENMKTE